MVPPLRGYRIFEDSLWGDVSCWGVLRITSIKDYHQKIEIKLRKSHIMLQKKEWGATRTASYAFQKREKGWPDASAKICRRSFQRHFGLQTGKWKGCWGWLGDGFVVAVKKRFHGNFSDALPSPSDSVISTYIDSSNYLIGVSRTISGRLNVLKIQQVFNSRSKYWRSSMTMLNMRTLARI